MPFLMNKTKDQISWVSSHDLYRENKMYKRKRSIDRFSEWNLRFQIALAYSGQGIKLWQSHLHFTFNQNKQYIILLLN